MQTTRTRVVTHSLALLLGAALGFLWVARDRSELDQLRSENSFLRDQAAQLEALQTEADRLRQEHAELASRMPKAKELAQLRASAVELQRVKQELAALRAASTQAAHASASQPPPVPEAEPELTTDESSPPFVMTGTAQLAFGETVISGGWELEPGRRGFVFVTPQAQEDGSVLLEAKVISIPEDIVGQVGLSELASSTRESEHHAVTAAEQTSDLLAVFQESAGVDVIAGPRVVTIPGNEAEISVLNASGKGISFRFNPRPQPDGASLALDMDLRVDTLFTP